MLFYLVVASLLVNSFASLLCPEGFTDPYEGKCFKQSLEGATWVAAERKCVDASSKFVIIHDAEKRAHINGIVGTVPTWFGGEYSNDLSKWIDNDGGDMTYTNWASGFPTSTPVDTCVIIEADEYKNIACSESKLYVCEIDKLVLHCDDGWTKLSDEGPCVKAVKKHKKTFSRALSACGAMGGTLATSVSSREHRNMIQATISFRGHFWIGFRADEPNGAYLDLAGMAPAEYRFKKGRPRANGPLCLTMKMKRWYDKKCNKYHHYICQKLLTNPGT